MHFLNDTKSRVGKVLRNYTGMRLKFRTTVFSELRSAAQPLKVAKLARSQQTSSKLI
ncbi:MAG: hypothetical protein ACI9E4_001197 [Pseudohongiellaceae bacterium]|jgi:hypothetical protein